ncbi:MAG: hypothetical protein FJ314_05480 [SAR202 cluster bacterium]|nr:hypothetical protein [SAR202 cluster bacterium]
MAGVVPGVALVLLGVAFAEFALLRLVLRMGPAFPAGEVIDNAMTAGYGGGLWALNTAGVLAVLLMLLTAAVCLRTARPVRGLATAVCASALLLLALWSASVAGVQSQSLLALQVAGVPLIAAAALAGFARHGRPTYWLLTAVAAHLLIAGAILTGAEGRPIPGLTLAAEALAVAGGIAMPYMFRAPLRIGPAIASGSIALVYGAATLAEPSMARFLLIWDFGMPGALPGVLHGLALGGAVYTALTGLGDPSRRLMVAGALLIVLAGLRLDNTYFSALAASGTYLILFTQPRLSSHRPAPAMRSMSRDLPETS